MNKIYYAMFIFGLIFIPINIHALTQSTELIEETSTLTIPFDLNLTNNTNYTVCIKTNNLPCAENEEITTSYNYSYSGGRKIGSFLKLYDFFSVEGISSASENYYCGLIDGETDGTLTINATCESEGGGGEILIENITSNVNIGNLSILFSSGDEKSNQYTDKVLPDEIITMKLNVYNISNVSNPLGMGTGDADIWYNIYNIKTGEVISGLSNRQITEVEGEWVEEFKIPITAPVGIISFNINAGSDFGGTYVIYRSIPIKQELKINETNIDMGDSVFLNLTNTVYYGEIDEINTSIKYPNGSIEKIILNSGNNYDYVFKTPTNQQGTYNVSISSKHKSGYTNIISKTFDVNEYNINVAKIKAIYSPGADVEISAALLDIEPKSVASEINFTFFDSEAEEIVKYINSETVIENNYHEVSYNLPFDALSGTYSIYIVVKDEYGIIYTKTKEFIVGDSLYYTLIKYTPESYDINITNLNTVKKRINITNIGKPITEINMSIINHTDYITFDVDDMNETLANSDKTYFYIEIMPEDDMPLGILTSTIKINISDERYEIPITLNVSLFSDIKLINDMAIELLANESNTIKIPVENTGLYILDNLDIKVYNEDFEDYITDIIYPDEIHVNETENIEIDLDEIESGLYTTVIEITNNDVTKTMNLNITVFDDFLTEINDLDDLRKSLHEDMLSLQQEGVFIGSSIEDDIELLQSKINDLNDYYASGNYSAAKELLDNLEMDAEDIEITITSLQTAQYSDNDADTYEETVSFCGDGFCDAGELCSCSDCYYEPQCEELPEETGGSGTLFVIIFVILLIVGGVIIVTSVVPDDWVDKNNKQF